MPETYQIESSLVHKLIVSCISAIILIGAYMLGWAYVDASWKAKMDEKMEQIQKYMIKLDDHIARPCHDVACERLQELKKHSGGEH